MISLTTDYIKGRGNPQPYLKAMAEAGFTHVNWCHHWNSDFLYSAPEIEQIYDWFKEYNLVLLDLHASAGVEKNWASAREYERKAGVELVGNRLHMANRLECETIILHVPQPPESQAGKAAYPDQVRRSLDEMQTLGRPLGVRIALENLIGDDFVLLRELLSEYSPDFLGLCYDSGHGNLDGRGLDQLETLKHRLISVHLHDNDGRKDQHRLILDGTIDWQRLAALMALSSYDKCVSSESIIHNTGITDENEFLTKAFSACNKFSDMIAKKRPDLGFKMMNDSSQSVKAHYNQSDLEQKIKAAFGKTGKKIEDLTRADIAALDEFHIRGREATRELAGLAGFRQGTSVLDLGCGVGGPARTLAAEFGCRVTGIDLIEEYCKAAEMLTEKVGLSERVAFQAGDITALSFGNDCFDAAWTQHITMNIEDKPRLFAEIRRVLKPGGSYALYEVCAGTTGSPHLPVPWAGSAAINFLVPPEDLLGFLQSTGFRQQVWQDVSNVSLEWFEKMKARRAKMPPGAPAQPGIGLFLGDDAGLKSKNLVRNLAENRIRVVQAVMRI